MLITSGIYCLLLTGDSYFALVVLPVDSLNGIPQVPS